ncbi:PREDICTED: protein NEDD1-like [Lupinus angustifolius]|uniref:protein NEDD1-like n=1 Tax=Lupinus angustifolius TaxID=3871 RepID=UPI00092F4498|nr:PREDICTED: protein NEDD1-like [Lupinus angustifolius]XP_019433197.1 PREDICTED: protein NEDD1-like [Lupinus angustifolius]XP_019433203.1 PREDICTED: protein NEDD1-like [Lupinus angustifolius]
MSLLAVSGGDTVKLFDASVKPGDPCILSYTSSPGYQVNSVKWNHTNLVVASAGDDKKISLWHKNGNSMGTIHVAGTGSGDGIEESISAISFSNKASKYMCSGGSGQVVRIWDLQKKRCIKWLRGHTNTVTGVMYNCKDEHLASISLSGDLILHNLASGARAADLKDPNQQMLRVLDYSRVSRHLLVTAGDDGTVHLWDTTGRSPKVSWLKQHSAPTAGISFSPSNDKILASVGLDKKLYTYDSGSRKPSFCISYEAPFTSLAFRDDGLMLAAGTSNGHVAFYDVRGKPKPFVVLHAHGSSEAVTSLCWQRSKPVIVDERNCTPETALVGNAVEDSILMPDPLPSATSNFFLSTSVSTARNPGRLGASFEASSLTASNSEFSSALLNVSAGEETPHRNSLWPTGTLSRLHAPHSSYNVKDDMEVFSPLVDVQPFTPSIWDENGIKKDSMFADRKPSMKFPSSSRRFPNSEEVSIDHPILDWKSSSNAKQDITQSSFSLVGSTPLLSSKNEDSSTTPPEAWGGEKLSDKYNFSRQPINAPSHFGMLASGGQIAGSMFSGLQGTSSSTGIGSYTGSSLSYANLRSKDISTSQETSLGFPDHLFSTSSSLSINTKTSIGQANIDSPRILDSPRMSPFPRRFSTYAERISTTSTFGDGVSLSVSSPKIKKSGAETREELLNSFLSKSDTSAPLESSSLPLTNGVISQHKASQSDAQQGSSFTLQLFQRTLEETLDSFQKSIHEDMRNLHIEILRQFHLQEMEMSSVMKSIMENQAELLNEVKSLRKENQQLRQML